MAKSNLTGVWKDVHGRIGDVVFRRGPRGLLLYDRPGPRDPNRLLSPGEAAQRKRFKDAIEYSRTVLADPSRRPFYEAVASARKIPVSAVIVGDFLNGPEVQTIDLSAYQGQIGDAITVQATDDVEVVSVTVVIRSSSGAVLEQGPATKGDTRWVYHATTAAPRGETLTVEATAVDRPGHSSMGSAHR